MHRDLPYGMVERYVNLEHMTRTYLMTHELCEILDCSRGFFHKNFRDLGKKFSGLKGKEIQIRKDIISERGGDRADEHSACYTDVFYNKFDVLNRIMSKSEITIQTDFLNLAQFFTGENLVDMFFYITEMQKRSRKPSEVIKLKDDGNRVIQAENNPLLRGIWFYDLARLNSYDRTSCPRVPAPEIFDGDIKHYIDFDVLFSAKHLARYYNTKTIETLHRRVVENAWARIKFAGRVWYIKQPVLEGNRVVKIPAITMKKIQQNYVNSRRKG